MADGVADVAPQLRRERGHPTYRNGGLDARIESGQMSRAQSAHGKTHTPDAPGVHLRARQQIINRPDVVPIHNTCPCEPGSEDGATDQLFTLAGALIEG